MYLNMVIKPVVCYRSKTSYDAEISINYFEEPTIGTIKAQFVIQPNLSTHEQAEKVSVDFVNSLVRELNLTLAFKIQGLKRV